MNESDIKEILDEIRREQSLMGREMLDIQHVVMGPPPGRTNGLRSMVVDLEKKVDDAMQWAHEIWNVRRRTECLGKEACAELEGRMDAKLVAAIDSIRSDIKEQNKLKIASINLKGVYAMGILQFFGIVLVALISAGAFK
jgi:hypothetical protein